MDSWDLERYYRSLLYPKTTIDRRVTDYVIALRKSRALARIQVDLLERLVAENSELEPQLREARRVGEELSRLPGEPRGPEDYEKLAFLLIDLEVNWSAAREKLRLTTGGE